jgi:hypothetical protein
MTNKKASAKFTIQFNRDNPFHLQVIEILNRQDIRGKARYIVNALLHYENCEHADVYRGIPNQGFDKMVEPIITRLMRSTGNDSVENQINKNNNKISHRFREV